MAPRHPEPSGTWSNTGHRKIVLTGDFLHVPDEDNPMFRDADVCFMDANTWHPAEWTSHQSVLGNLRLIDNWRPKQVYFVHYSGYEDRERTGDRINGPLSLARLQQELAAISDGRNLQGSLARNGARRHRRLAQLSGGLVPPRAHEIPGGFRVKAR